MLVSQCIRVNRFICVYLRNRKCSLRVVSVATCTGKFHPHHHTCPSLISWSLSLLAAELAEGSRGHAEAAAPCEAPWAEQEEPGAGDPELQGGGPETAQDHLPAGEGARPIHQWSQWPHTKGKAEDWYISARLGQRFEPDQPHKVISGLNISVKLVTPCVH